MSNQTIAAKLFAKATKVNNELNPEVRDEEMKHMVQQAVGQMTKRAGVGDFEGHYDVALWDRERCGPVPYGSDQRFIDAMIEHGFKVEYQERVPCTCDDGCQFSGSLSRRHHGYHISWRQ